MGEVEAGKSGNVSLQTSGRNVLTEQLVFVEINFQADGLLWHPIQVLLGGLLTLLDGELGQQGCRDVGGAGLLRQVKNLLLQI